ncbi:SRPBCC family protein [Pontimicrobium aquaticum]|uniref:SRPBCC family protein n=1 Tax=Pontimicrobium aquaticum TaxID=2565367 RepID=A0A4U0EL55_9FLAO|nr:SRPBCC family protein [Pontimicrobium aquaticum]TJY32191.1 SRPBCC family protein [Pontimicrobium aquaticum]
MKYSVEVTIEKPRNEVIKKLDNVDNMKHWQKGLASSEHISGTPGEVGAKMRLNYKMGKRNLTLIETITKRNLPNEFNGTYTAKGMHNIQENYFEETSEGNTKWISNCEFQPSSFMMKVMVFLMPGAFKKQSKQYMIDFKNFVEKGVSVAEEK